MSSAYCHLLTVIVGILESVVHSTRNNFRCIIRKDTMSDPLTTLFDTNKSTFPIVFVIILSGCGGSGGGGGGGTSGVEQTETGVEVGVATLAWTPPTTNTDGTTLDDLAGYKIYYGKAIGNYTNKIDITNPGIATYVVESLSMGTFYFVVTAYDLSGNESKYSNVASKVIN